MASSFASRLSGLRQKKINSQNQQQNLKLTLPPDLSQKSTYEPSNININSRTSMRLLKGRIDRTSSSEKQQLTSTNLLSDSKGFGNTQKLTYNQIPKSQLKLVLNDSPVLQQKKVIVEAPKVPLQKRIIVQKQPPKQQEPKQEQIVVSNKKIEEIKKQEPKKQLPPPPTSSMSNFKAQQQPIRQQEAQQSLPPESQNDLVACPQGCGRKFNRKALQKHAKACKLVFMSKRKEFNSEAKRIVTKQQAQIVKQNKIQEKKKMGATKGKGFDKTKTGDNWKAASEDFRSAIKAIKKEEKEQEQQEQVQEIGDELQDKKITTVLCQYCEKKFNQIFIEKHLENCVKKKQKQRKKGSVKK